ncbi:hypothetical protein AcW1_002739 [Taiwanofungus camphoratus]|nr:hypothetical protein AcW1_002739 [Antrodia cinnamomea]
MTDFSTTTPSIGAPRSPLFGTATFSTLSPTQTPMSPSRLSSSSCSATPIASSYDSDDASSGRQMRRIIISPSPSSGDSDTYAYTDDNSIDEAAEVEAALSMVDNELASTEDVLTEWSRGSSTGPSTYTSHTGTGASTYTSFTGSGTTPGTSGSYASGDNRSAATTVQDRERRVLSTISEHTENVPSRPTSFSQSGGAQGSRPNTQYSNNSAGDVNGPSTHMEGRISPALHVRSSTEPSGTPHTLGRALPPAPGRRAGELIAFFEDKTAALDMGSPRLFGHTRTASAPSGPRSPSPYTTTQSRSMPTLSSAVYGYGSTAGHGSTTGYESTTGYGYNSRPSSPTKSRAGSSLSSSGPITTMSSLLSPPPRAQTSLSNDSRTPQSVTGSTTQTSFTRSGAGTYTAPTTNTSSITYTPTFTRSSLSTITGTPTISSFRRPQTSPRSPLTSVRNIVAAWKERTPSLAKSARSNTTSPPSPMQSNVDFGLAGQGRMGPRDPTQHDGGGLASTSGSRSLSTSGLLPPPFDLAELGHYADIKGSEEPINIGLLWYLNVHAPPPYRWQRCQALLYPHMLLLSWIAPGGGRGIVTLDLLNCIQVGSLLSPMHPGARDDVGTVAARMQSENAGSGGQLGEMGLVETLCPFQLVYSDGVERLGAESAKERSRWVEAIWEALNREVSIPDRSMTGSPTGSVRTMRSITSSGTVESGSGTGSASTVYVPPLDSIPDLSDLMSLSGSSTRTGISRRPSLASAHRARATDDSAVSHQAFLYPGDPRVIAPSRSSSLRRTSSLTDLDQEFASAVRRAREARPGLGFGLGLAGGIPVGDGSPVTVSSGPRLGRDVYMSPPPSSVGRGSDKAKSYTSDATSVSDEAFFTADSASNGSRTQTSTFYSSSSFTRALTNTETRTGTGLVTDETALDIVSGSGTNIVPSTLSLRGPTSASLLGDSHSGSSGISTSTSPSRGGLSRTREVRRRTPRNTSRSYSSSCMSSTSDISDKENSGTYTPSGTRSYTDGLSTLETYTRSGSYTPTPSSSSYTQSTEGIASSGPTTSTEGSEYVTARTPSTASFVSLPTIPSLPSDYETAEVCSTEYEAAPKCPTEPASDYETAEICPTEPSSEYITAELCSTEVSTDYDTAECRCKEDIRPPSPIPTIPSSPATELEVLGVLPEDVPLPPSTYSPTVASTDLTGGPGSPKDRAVASPSPVEPTLEGSSTESIPGPSPILPSESLLEPSVSISTVSTPTESSVSPTPSSQLTPSIPSTIEQPPTPSSPAIPESLWAAESDESYESSLLRASPSVQSLALPEGPDTSFETSFLRPSGSVYSSQDVTLLTPITEISTASSVTLPSSPSSSLTPTPSTVSLPPSVPSPTPISTEAPVPTLMRTPSSVSTVSSVSMSSSIFDASSLLDVPTAVEPSTEPSLLSTARSPTPSRSLSPPSIPLPPSPSATSVSMSVSLSTPRGDVPSIMSELETIPSEAPSHILTHDVNRLLHYIHDINQVRGEENQALAGKMDTVTDMLTDLLHSLSRDRAAELPPPVPRKDRSVGGSTVSSLGRPTPAGPRDRPRLIPIPLSPFPERIPSPDTLTETMSFLSSHHSDDLSLLESEVYPAASPSWPSSPSSSPESSPQSSSISIRPRSSPTSVFSPSLPPSSPTPSSTSSGTARPAVPVNLSDLREQLGELRREVATMQDGQNIANETLREIDNRLAGQDMTECCRRIEDALQRLLELAQHPQPPTRDDVSESIPPSGSDDMSFLADWTRLREDSTVRDAPQIHMPIPVRIGPSLDEQLADIMATGAPPVQHPVHFPPPLIPLVYRPGPRVSRPRSASPIYETDLPPRPGTYPIMEPVRFERPSRRVPRVGPRRRFVPPPISEGEDQFTPRVVPWGPDDVRRPDPGESDIDFLRAVQDRRRGRGAPDGFFTRRADERFPTDRPPTAPADLGPAAPRPGAPGQPTGVPFVPFVPQPPGPPPVPQPPAASAPTILQLPLLQDILTLLREGRLASLATIDQQREIMRYYRDLNEWIARYVQDRQAEIQGVHHHIDQVREDIMEQLLRRPPEGARPPMIPPPGTVPQVTSMMPPVVPMATVPQQTFPPGFVPQGMQPPAQAVVVHPFPTSRTPSPAFTPVIPSSPRGISQVPVIPDTSTYPPPPPPSFVPIRYESAGPADERDVVPPRLASPYSSSESSPRDIHIIPQPQSGPVQGPITVIPPPMQVQEPTVVPMQPSESRPSYREEERQPTEYGASRRASPTILQLPAPTEPRVGSPRHPEAPSAQPIIVPGQPIPHTLQQVPPVIHPAPPLGPIIIHPPTVPRTDVRSGSPEAPPAVIREEREQPTFIIPSQLERTPSGRTYRRERSRSPSGVPVIIQPPVQQYPGQPIAMPAPPSGGPMAIQRTPSPMTPRRRSRSPSVEADRPSRRRSRPRELYLRSPSPIVVRTPSQRHERSRRSPPMVHEGDPHRSRSPTLVHGHEPEAMTVRLSSSRRHPSPHRDYEDPSQRRPRRLQRSPPRSLSPAERDRSPTYHEGTRSQRSRPARSEHRSPSSEGEQPRRTPRSEREREPRRPRTRRVSPSERDRSRSPVLQVRSPSRQESPTIVRIRSRHEPRASSPTIVQLDEGTPETEPQVVRIPSRPTERARRPSEVTSRRYEEGSPVQEPAELARTPSAGSRWRDTYEAERPTPGVTRVPTHRTAMERPMTPRTPVRRIPEDQDRVRAVLPTAEHAPTYEAAPPGSPPALVVPGPGRAGASPPPRSVAVELHPHRASGPGDLWYEDAERERQERFGELERQVTGTISALQEAEERRDQHFRENEDEREQIFERNEARRDQEAIQRRDEIWRELEDRLAAIPTGGQVPIPVPPPTTAPAAPGEEVPPSEAPVEAIPPAASETQSVAQTIRDVAQDAASRHAQDILDTVRMEREELARDRELAQAERERLLAETKAEQERRIEERDARIRALEEEVATVRAELENERQLRLTEETERRERERVDMLERDEAMRTQLGDITNLVSEQRDECVRKRELMNERWDEKQTRRAQKDAWNTELREMVEQIIADREADRARQEQEQAAEAERPTIQTALDQIAELRAHQDEVLRNMAESWRADCARQHEQTLEAVRATAEDRVSFNIQAYLDDFSRSLATEVRVLLSEVGKLREEKRNLQFELGCLLTMKSKYGPGGEFDPDW